MSATGGKRTLPGKQKIESGSNVDRIILTNIPEQNRADRERKRQQDEGQTRLR